MKPLEKYCWARSQMLLNGASPAGSPILKMKVLKWRHAANYQKNAETLKYEGMQYVGSARINDWRYKNETDKIISLFFQNKIYIRQSKSIR